MNHVEQRAYHGNQPGFRIKFNLHYPTTNGIHHICMNYDHHPNSTINTLYKNENITSFYLNQQKKKQKFLETRSNHCRLVAEHDVLLGLKNLLACRERKGWKLSLLVENKPKKEKKQMNKSCASLSKIFR